MAKDKGTNAGGGEFNADDYDSKGNCLHRHPPVEARMGNSKITKCPTCDAILSLGGPVEE